MTAEQILDFSTKGQFWTTENGGKLQQFAQDLYTATTADVFPISLTKASEVLLFSSENIGGKTIRNWNESGLLVIAQQKPLAIARRELVVSQLIKAIFAEDEQTYQMVYDRLKADLSGSGLETHLGSELKPSYGTRIGVVALIEPTDPWPYDLIPLNRKRARHGGH